MAKNYRIKKIISGEAIFKDLAVDSYIVSID